MAERFDQVEHGSLSDYISPDKFRTVTEEQRSLLGLTEIAVELQLKPPARALLSFSVPWDGDLYGCVRGKAELQEKLGLPSPVSKIYIQDWDNRFLVLFEQEGSDSCYAVFVPTEDVVYLLENCRRIPEHCKNQKG